MILPIPGNPFNLDISDPMMVDFTWALMRIAQVRQEMVFQINDERLCDIDELVTHEEYQTLGRLMGELAGLGAPYRAARPECAWR